MRIAIFASGSGSNAETLIKKAQDLAESVSVEFVLGDKKEAFVFTRAQNLGVRTYLVEKTGTRSEHEEQILKLVDEHRIDWILLAGYMRLISASFLQSLKDRHGGVAQILNIHPSLLPAYPGVDSIERAYQDQVSESGVTIHFVDEGMDTGPHVLQEKLKLESGESLSSFKNRIHALEHRMYAQVLENIVSGKIPTQNYMRKS